MPVLVLVALVVVALLASYGALTLQERGVGRGRPNERTRRRDFERLTSGPVNTLVSQLARLAQADTRLETEYEPPEYDGDWYGSVTITLGDRSAHVSHDGCCDVVTAHLRPSDEEIWLDDDPPTALAAILLALGQRQG